ncbi:MAG: hypothetical protein ABW095_07720 [Candidatus Thiodiazotropha sp.]
MLLMPACGGGGGGGGGGDEQGSTDSEDPVVDDGDGTSDETGSGGTGSRVSRVRFDFDNNGVFEGVREYEYASDGKIIQERYTYTDDGTADVELGNALTLSNSIDVDSVDETVSYAYDSEGRLQTWVGYNNETRQTCRYTYNADDLITRIDVTIEDGSGAITSQYQHALSYSGQRLVEHTMTMDGETSPTLEFAIVYDAAGYVIENNMTTTQSGLVSRYAYTYLANDRTDTITDTVPTLSAYRMAFEFGYNVDDQPAYLNFITEGTGNDSRYSFVEQYDADGRHVTRQVDDRIDGTIDAVVEIEWEEMACVPVLDWHPRTLVPDPVDSTSPYKPGTGYVWLRHCIDGI